MRVARGPPNRFPQPAVRRDVGGGRGGVVGGLLHVIHVHVYTRKVLEAQ